ncbi:hypothetical protein J3A83DRAFT_4191355 [Scleroderma citrinum]
MPTPSKTNFFTFPSCQELEVTNLMNADEDVLDGMGNVPDNMRHTFRRGDNVIIQGERGTLWYGVINDIRVQRLKTMHSAEGMDCSMMVLPKGGHNRKQHLQIYIIAREEILSPAEVIKFTEGEGCGPLIESEDMFTRWSMTASGQHMLEGTTHVCQVCQKAYNPDKDHQRYCRTCRKWFHCGCLKRLPKASNKMQEYVIEQGRTSGLWCNDKFIDALCIPISQGKVSGVVGNGMTILAMWGAFEKSQEEDVEIDWNGNLTSDVLEHTTRLHVYYQCPLCSKAGRASYM